MILRKDMTYLGDELYPNTNFANEPEGSYYIVDESTKEGQAMANTILACHPNFTIVVAEDGLTVKAVSGTPRPMEKSEMELLKEDLAAVKADLAIAKSDIAVLKTKVPK